MTRKKNDFDCGDCPTLNCYRKADAFPGFCLTEAANTSEVEEVNKLYREDPQTAKIAAAGAEIEGTYYGRLTRVEEVVAFARRIGAKKIGIATCIGLMNETKTFIKFLEAQGLESYSVICKVGSVDKTEIGIPEKLKVQQGVHESICNPILQARILEREGTDLNVVVGLCVGHDTLFIQHSAAPVTYLIVKDRVLGHNPAAALYTSQFYYKRLFEQQNL